MRKFKAHFNRVNMQRGNPNVWTVHTSIACHQGTKIRILLPVETIYRPDRPQPRAYFEGRGRVRMQGSTIIVY